MAKAALSNDSMRRESAQLDALSNRILFTEVDANTRSVIQEYMPALKAALPDILSEFYAHIGKWPDLAAMFKDQSRMEYARLAQQRHWMHLFEAKFDEQYAASVRKIGLVHSRIGLEPTWYIGAYAFTLNRLYQHAAHYYQNRLAPHKAQEKTARLMRALNQCVMIDMDMAISVYLEENKRTYKENLDELARQFEATIGGIVHGVSSASAEMEASAESLASMSAETSAGADAVAAASVEASANVSAVSSASEEMSASIGHVAEMAQRSYQAAEQAAEEADNSVARMQELKIAIDKISEVANLIS